MKVTHFNSNQELTFHKVPATKMGSPMVSAITLQVDDKPMPHPVLGFGVAITGSSCYNLNLMEPGERKAFLDSIYGKDGLNLNVGRLTVGSSDYSAEMYTYDDVPGDTELEHFSMERDEEYIIPMTKEVVAANPDLYLFASPWSPPGWMKTGGYIAGGEMRDKFVEVYAKYFVKYLKQCEAYGIHVSTVTPQNEPGTDTRGHYAGCLWHAEIEAHFVHALRKELTKEGMDTGIWLYDFNFEGWRRVLWSLQEDPELQKDLTGIAFHYYNENIEKVQPLLQEFPDIPLHFTEAGPRLYDNYATDHCKWGTMISKAFNNGCRSFTGWNLMLDETGGPNVGPFFCAGFATRNSQTGALTYSGQLRAMAHFSKFVQRGAQVLPSRILGDGYHMSTYPKVDMPVESCAFRNPDGSLVVVLTNPSRENRKQIQMEIGGDLYYIAMLPDSVSTVIVEP